MTLWITAKVEEIGPGMFTTWRDWVKVFAFGLGCLRHNEQFRGGNIEAEGVFFSLQHLAHNSS